MYIIYTGLLYFLLYWPQLGPHTALFGLKNWQEPYRNQSVFGTEEMKAFLPYNDNIMLGMPYPVVQDKPPGIFEETRMHSNNRFYPQAPKGSEQVLYRLLGMMHPRPFVHMRFPPRGTYACVRAFNADYYHIIFRCGYFSFKNSFIFYNSLSSSFLFCFLNSHCIDKNFVKLKDRLLWVIFYRKWCYANRSIFCNITITEFLKTKVLFSASWHFL